MGRPKATLLACLPALLLPACHEDKNVVAPALSATCEARPASGPAPLAVSFLLNVTGAQGPVTVSINYGDGQTGTNPDTAHSYTAPGTYAASFDVTTQTQSSRCTTTVSVGPGPASGNQPPTAVFKTTPTASGSTIKATASPVDVIFNMCASSDPEGDELYFLVDFEGDDHFDFGGITGGHCRVDHVYTSGRYEPENCLYDRDKNGKALHDDICKTYVIVVP